ncbi:MAG TPA: hypothetical protein VFA92_01890, partial [Candidatus Binatia bacterium]|nr:hypothetical protein [Candidatus Binatia bacterium]
AGSYAQHFLEKAGDAYFFGDPNEPKLPDTKVSGPEPANWVLNAISHNHAAAADWLLGHPPGEDGEEGENVTRFSRLIVGPASQSGALQLGDNEQAVNNLVAAAGSPDSGRSKEMLGLFVKYPPEMVADGFKPGIARAVGENIPTLLQVPKDVQDQLLDFATKNPDGSANDDAALAFATESGKYLRTLVDGHEMRSENLYDVWDKSSEVLTLLHDHLSEIDEESEQAKEIRNSILWGAVDLAPLPGKGLLADAADKGKSVLIRTWETYQATHGASPDPRSQIDSQVRYLIAQRYVAQHSDLVAHGQTADDVALGLATGRVENVPGHEQLAGGKKTNDEMYDFLNFVHGVRSNGGE